MTAPATTGTTAAMETTGTRTMITETTMATMAEMTETTETTETITTMAGKGVTRHGRQDDHSDDGNDGNDEAVEEIPRNIHLQNLRIVLKGKGGPEGNRVLKKVRLALEGDHDHIQIGKTGEEQKGDRQCVQRKSFHPLDHTVSFPFLPK